MMKVLWISNYLFPDVCKKLNLEVPVVGGWMYSSAKNLVKLNVKLGVAAIYSGKTYQRHLINGIEYFLVPNGNNKNNNTKGLEKFWQRLEEEFNPMVTHIHGSEYGHGLAYVNAIGAEKVVVSIQGLVSVYENYYYGQISILKLITMTTFRDIVRLDTIFQNKVNMKKRGLLEIELIKKVNHVIGRTTWDKSHTWKINPNVNYHFCNETLRSVFYKKKWALEKCQLYTIFISQAHYPIKGFHQLLEALPFVLRNYPNVKVFISGSSFGLDMAWRKNAYGKYLNELINKNKLSDHIVYLGQLNEDEMLKRYLNSNIVVSTSNIENSSNSICEAQLLGIPCIASYVGGTPDLITHGYNGLLYRFEEVVMLANNICTLFSNPKLTNEISLNGIQTAQKRHDENENSKTLKLIYNRVLENKTLEG